MLYSWFISSPISPGVGRRQLRQFFCSEKKTNEGDELDQSHESHQGSLNGRPSAFGRFFLQGSDGCLTFFVF